MRFNAWSFAYLLSLVPVLVLLYAYAFRRRRQALSALVERKLAEGVLARIDGRRWWRASCLVGAAICFMVALMQPQWGRGDQDLPLRGRDVVVLLDVSLSMLAEDARPNRLAQAKASARSLVEAMRRQGGHRVALLTFAGRADVRCPLTRDYDLFLKRLDDTTVENVSRPGTSIGDAVRQALSLFGDLAPGYTDLVLLSDGEDQASLPLEAAQMLQSLQVNLHTVGIGDPQQDARIPVARDGGEVSYLIYDGQEVRTRMREGTLVGMADTAGGTYVSGGNGTARLDRFYQEQIANKPRRELDSGADRQLDDQFHLLVILAMILLGIEMVMREPRRSEA